MNRRELLLTFRDFCILNGISNILSPSAFGQVAAVPKKRFVSFVIKYTSAGNLNNGPGEWNFDSVLKPLAPYSSDICRPMGLSCKFATPADSHSAANISPLTGTMTGNALVAGLDSEKKNTNSTTIYNYTTGNGKSIDVLIGEKLQSLYSTQIPMLQISNINVVPQSSRATAHKNSSWGNNGILLPTFSTVNDLSQELQNRISCNSGTVNPVVVAGIKRKIAALDIVKNNSNIYNSNYLIDKENFDLLEAKLQMAKNNYNNALNVNSGTPPAICGNFPTQAPLAGEYTSKASIRTKMNVMFDLAIAAFQANVTRSLTVNLSISSHPYSHFVAADGVLNTTMRNTFVDVSKFHHELIASFIVKLKVAGLYTDTMIYCNAGSSMFNNCHNYDNMSTYIVNGGKSGIVGSPTTKKPIGSLLLDILHKFGINYDLYGANNNIAGPGIKGNFI